MFNYQVEYAKSSNSECKVCKENITKGELRIGILIKPQDYYIPLWRHEICFFKNGKRLGTIQQFKDYNTLKPDDKLRIKEKLVDPSEDFPASVFDILGLVLNERDKAIISEYGVEESNNSSARCRLCNIQIVKKELRISKIQYEEKRGEIKHYYHVKCFANVRNEFNFPGSGEYMPGFEILTNKNQEIVKSYIRQDNIVPPHTEFGPSSSKCTKLGEQIKYEDEQNKENINKIKTETSCELESEAVRLQSELFHKYKSSLRSLSKQDLKIICKRNNLYMFKGTEEPLDLLADCMVFGALQPCPKCNGQLKLTTFRYECSGFISEYFLCTYTTKSPQRVLLTVPDELKHYSALKDYEPSIGVRIFDDEPSDYFQPSLPKRIKMEATAAPLKNVLFYIHISNKEDKETVKCRVLKSGGCIAPKLVETVAAVIAAKEDYQKNTPLTERMKLGGFHIVEVSFLDEVESLKNSLSVPESIELIEEHNISEFSSDIYSRVPRQVLEGEPVRVSGGVYILKSDQPHISTLKVKDGIPLVMGTGLERWAHVYREKGEPYSATLNRVYMDARHGTNRSYTMQLLVADVQKRYCVVRSCGPTGSEPKHYKKEFEDLGEAKAFFRDVFYKKTGNIWTRRHNFQKKYGKFDLIEMADLSEREPEPLCLDSQSELPRAVQELMILLFDINIMNKTIADMDIDTDKMPLGVPSQEQISSGFRILGALYDIVSEGREEYMRIEELSTRFYTKIPHKGNFKELVLLDNVDLIRSKMHMLDDLSKTHVSYKILHEDMDVKIGLMQQYYLKLKTEILPLDTDSPEYGTVMKYSLNTQSKAHSFQIKVEQIFSVDRQGEAERFEPYAAFPNRKLLWHGSRLSNVAAILLEGLRIAPEGVERTGDMFGKGIYFADVVTKSAQYAYTTPDHPAAVLLLCRVALGNMKRCTRREPVTELPQGTNSVWGVGRFRPDPAAAEILPDGTEVPLGALVPNTRDDPDEPVLIHNEYIVYDEAQVNIKYLVQLQIV
ncbi:poly [ADP-ribose] polymerase 1-like isoform X2 [Pieris napi]|uniref:poly [ADP-ribose] polymerase 1-like isoform X2 n=1 Tax=Pieris napi TaxID=78633 RepID=UPI001FB95351|nr:poly [ADP-ribose] polymerase 1-like isoform X2 [Pieris napi]